MVCAQEMSQCRTVHSILELSLPFTHLEGLAKFFNAWGQEKLLGCGLLGEISTQADTMNRCFRNLKTVASELNPSKISERVHF